MMYLFFIYIFIATLLRVQMGCAPNKTKSSKSQIKQDQESNKKPLPSTNNTPKISGYSLKQQPINSPPYQYPPNNFYPPYSSFHHSGSQQFGASNPEIMYKKVTDMMCSNEKMTKESVKGSKKWFSLQQIFNLPQEKQKKYWEWYFTKYVQEYQQNKGQIQHSNGSLSPAEILDLLPPEKKTQIFRLFEQAHIEEQSAPPRFEASEVKIDLSKFKKECDEYQEGIYVLREEKDLFKETESVEVFENSEMSKIEID